MFAQLLGTYWLLLPVDQDLLRGFIVNKFRGEIELFRDGVSIIEERSGRPVVGVVPYLHASACPTKMQPISNPTNHRQRTHSNGRYCAAAHQQLRRLRSALYGVGCESDLVREPAQLGRPDVILIPVPKALSAI